MSEVGAQRPVVPRALVVRRALASVLSLGAAALLAWLVWPFVWDRGARCLGLVAFAFLPVVATVSIWSRHLALQLLARGIWWSLLLVGALLSIASIEGSWAGPLAVGSAAALLLAGRGGLDGGDSRFQPIAFRGTLMLALVLAMADAASFLWMGLGEALVQENVTMILFVPPMIAGVIGLLRLRTWGLLVSLACNVLVVVLAGTGKWELNKYLRGFFIGTAALQILVPIPMWIAIIRRRRPPPDRWRRAKFYVSTAAIVGIAAAAVVMAYLHEQRFPYFL